MKFVITNAIVNDRQTEPGIWTISQDTSMLTEHEEVTITISLAGSGDTRKFTDGMLLNEIIHRLKGMDATNLQYLKINEAVKLNKKEN